MQNTGDQTVVGSTSQRQAVLNVIDGKEIPISGLNSVAKSHASLKNLLGKETINSMNKSSSMSRFTKAKTPLLNVSQNNDATPQLNLFPIKQNLLM